MAAETQAVQTAQDTAPAVMPMPAQERIVLVVKIRLQGRERYQFEALKEFYGVSDNRLGQAAVQHFLDSIKTAIPKIGVL